MTDGSILKNSLKIEGSKVDDYIHTLRDLYIYDHEKLVFFDVFYVD